MLEKILEAREKRAYYRNELKAIYNKPVVTFTINIPRGEKNNPKYNWLCKLAVEEYLGEMGDKKNAIRYFEERVAADGPEAFLVVDEMPLELKRIGMEVEEEHVLGRLFDIDVSGVDRKSLSRSFRRCIVCDRDAVDCIVNRRHDYQEVFAAIDRMIEYRKERICNKVAELVVKSMLYEISCTPKPGLVDMKNNGSHRDMNYFTFLDSAVALTPYFQSVVREAVKWDGRPEELLDRIRPLGIRAEKDMLKVTGGVNTHKGQIFSLGLVCAAAAYILQRRGRADIERISEMVKRMAKKLVKEELEAKRDTANDDNLTAGEQLYILYGCKGVRGEAASGFQAAVEIGVPALKEALSGGTTFNHAMVHSLMHIMKVVEDTNAISRGGLEGIEVVRRGVGGIIEAGSVFTGEGMEAIHELDRQLIRMNISPGGAADMLALSVFFYYIGKIRI